MISKFESNLFENLKLYDLWELDSLSINQFKFEFTKEIKSSQMPTQGDAHHGKSHAIFDKDVFRVMKADTIVKKSKLVHKPSGEKSILEYNNYKYKTRSQLIMDQYENPSITEDKLYLIDKVVRLRGANGRFGVDHSEILNYELELANR